MECRVCQNSKASKHNYYGATSICASCRGFFMRAVQSDTYKAFCHSHQCKIDSQSRTSCKKCRLEKCLEVGMKISYVKTLKENCQKVLQCQKIKKVCLRESFLDSEKQAIKELHSAQWNHSCNTIFSCYSKNPVAFLVQFCQSPPPNGVNTDCFLLFMEYIDKCNYFGLCKILTEKDGTTGDLHALWRHNMPKVSSLYRALLFMDNWADSYFTFARQHRHESYDLNQLMLLQDQYGVKEVRMEYKMFFASPWAADSAIEEEHRRIYMVLKY